MLITAEVLALGTIAWFALMLVSTNLLGFLALGFVTTPVLDESSPGLTTQSRPRLALASMAFVIGAGILWLLSSFLSPVFAVVTAMLMISRLPDVVWEIRNGRKIELSDIPRAKWSYVISVLSWLALPLSCFGAYTLLK